MPAMLLTSSLGAQLDTLFAGFDLSIFSFFGNIQNDFLTLLARFFSAMGDEIFVIPFAIFGVVLCFFKRTRRVGFSIVFAIIIGTLITNVIIKPMFLRIRPYNTLQANADYWSWYVSAGMLSESDYCFPSGHTTSGTEIAIVLMICHIRSKCRKSKAVVWIFPIVALCIGASRIYLMLHYATDVIAGFIIGIIAAIAGYLLAGLVCKLFKRDKAPEVQALMEKNIRTGWALTIALVYTVLLVISFSCLNYEAASDPLRCAYDEEYKCQNEAQTGSSYPAIDGKYYCKIHWKELSGK